MLATILTALEGLLRRIKYSLRFHFHVCFLFHVRFRVPFGVRVNLNMALRIYMPVIAIILLISRRLSL